MERRKQIHTVQYECEEGCVALGVKQGCFGAWVAVRSQKTLGTHAIRPLQWVPKAISSNES